MHAEFYYSSVGANINFDPEFTNDSTFNARYAVRLNNAPILLALADADWAVAPTCGRKAASRILHDKIVVMHEGINTAPDVTTSLFRFTLPDGRNLNSDDEVITFLIGISSPIEATTSLCVPCQLSLPHGLEPMR